MLWLTMISFQFKISSFQILWSRTKTGSLYICFRVNIKVKKVYLSWKLQSLNKNCVYLFCTLPNFGCSWFMQNCFMLICFSIKNSLNWVTSLFNHKKCLWKYTIGIIGITTMELLWTWPYNTRTECLYKLTLFQSYLFLLPITIFTITTVVQGNSKHARGFKNKP